MAAVWCFLIPLVLVLGTVVATPTSSIYDLVDAELSSDIEKRCPIKEHHDECRAGCQKNCTTINDNPGLCPASCVPGCICDEPLIRGPNGTCIDPKRCPSEPHEEEPFREEEDRSSSEEEESDEEEDADSFCPRNEKFVVCKAHCEPNCKNQNATTECSFCASGCRCVEGYVRGPKGTCIKPDKCPDNDVTIYPVERVCPEAEVWNKYVAHCQGNCSTKGKLMPCVRMAVAGCICKKGTFRRNDGVCVPLEKCPKKDEVSEAGSFCPNNEEYIKGHSNCEKDCKNRDELFCNGGRGVWVSGCRCVRDYVRGPKGGCIKPDTCPAKDNTKYPVKRVCPKGEHWDVSTAHCQKNCTNFQKPIPCPKISVSGCVCNNGHYRRKDGKCVPKSQCPKKAEDEMLDSDEVLDEAELVDVDEIVDEDEMLDQSKPVCPKNETFVACYGHCEQDCKNKNETVVPCARSLCVSECRCNWGFVRGPRGTCIKPEKCPPKDNTKYPVKRVCPHNEIWDKSTAHCQKNCTNVAKPPPCPKVSQPGCVCKKGFLRARKGECVPRNKCPKRAEEEIFDEDEIFVEVEEVDPDELVNVEELLDQSTPFCPENEFYVSGFSHCEQDCKNKNTVNCTRGIWVSGCRCSWGFVRGPKGICIKPEKCPAKDNTKYPVKRVCPKDEHWETSRAHCQKNCTNIAKPPPCAKITQPGCVCDKDLLRGKDGKCIPRKQCPKKAEEEIFDEDEVESEDELVDEDEILDQSTSFCPDNEIYVAGFSHCEQDCKHKSVANCTRGIWVPGCRCAWGLVRGPEGICIKPEKCPAKDNTKYPVKRKCPENERWETTKAHCQKNCTNIAKPPSCGKITQPGCVCNNDLLRGKDGKCIPRKQCPKKAEDHDEDALLYEDEVVDQGEVVDLEDLEDQHESTDAYNDEELEESTLPEESAEDSVSGSGGCPNERECTKWCRAQRRRYGRCLGRHRKRCNCQ